MKCSTLSHKTQYNPDFLKYAGPKDMSSKIFVRSSQFNIAWLGKKMAEKGFHTSQAILNFAKSAATQTRNLHIYLTPYWVSRLQYGHYGVSKKPNFISSLPYVFLCMGAFTHLFDTLLSVKILSIN